MEIHVTEVQKGLPGISAIAGMHLYETFEVCMHLSGHPERVLLKTDGLIENGVFVNWEDLFDSQKARTYADIQYTTEHAAVCLAVMLTTSLTPLTVIERSRKGTGIDYWLGEKDSILFQRKARLEVSGIFKGNDDTMRWRHEVKTKQSEKSRETNLPVYIAIIEFSQPKALFTKK